MVLFAITLVLHQPNYMAVVLVTTLMRLTLGYIALSNYVTHDDKGIVTKAHYLSIPGAHLGVVQ
jgi:hypothetical protein